jgi:hypothetical protein
MFQNIKNEKCLTFLPVSNLKAVSITSSYDRLYKTYTVNSVHFKHNEIYTKISIIN